MTRRQGECRILADNLIEAQTTNLEWGAMAHRFDVCVRGTGIVGRSLALALSSQGLSVALQGATTAPFREDVRAYALNAESVALLDGLKVWSTLPADARTAVYDMRIEGDAAAVLRFSAWQQAVRELAWIVDALCSAVRMVE